MKIDTGFCWISSVLKPCLCFPVLRSFVGCGDTKHGTQIPLVLLRLRTTEGYSDVLLGMLTQNVQLIEGGIKKSVAYHKKMKESLFIEFCLEATAMVKLAKIYGFEVQVDTSHIHQGLLQHDPDITFEDIDEVYKALGIIKI